MLYKRSFSSLFSFHYLGWWLHNVCAYKTLPFWSYQGTFCPCVNFTINKRFNAFKLPLVSVYFNQVETSGVSFPVQKWKKVVLKPFLLWHNGEKVPYFSYISISKGNIFNEKQISLEFNNLIDTMLLSVKTDQRWKLVPSERNPYH